MNKLQATTLGSLLNLRQRVSSSDAIRILLYHGIVEQKQDLRLERNLHLLSAFRDHMYFLRQFTVLSLSDLVAELGKPNYRHKPRVVITFDDGYANNLLAGEILDDLHLPWSIFVSTGQIGTSETIWTVELSLLLLQGSAEHLDLADTAWPLQRREQREHAFQFIRGWLKRLPANERKAAMNSLRSQYPAGETERLVERFPSLRMLSWNEVRQLADTGVAIGSHGVDHELHHGGQSQETRQYELSASKLQIESELGSVCSFFAFPNGDFNENSAAEITAAGYTVAFTTVHEAISIGGDKLLLPRLGAPTSIRSLARNFY